MEMNVNVVMSVFAAFRVINKLIVNKIKLCKVFNLSLCFFINL